MVILYMQFKRGSNVLMYRLEWLYIRLTLKDVIEIELKLIALDGAL